MLNTAVAPRTLERRQENWAYSDLDPMVCEMLPVQIISGTIMEKRRLKQIEESILSLFQRQRAIKLLAREVFVGSPHIANADLVRAFEDLEKRHRLLIRYTDEGNDWVHLTPKAAKQVGLTEFEGFEMPEALPHPPKSST